MNTAVTLWVRVALLALLLAAGGCARRSPAVRAVAAPVRDELDPLGFVVERRSDLELTAAQMAAVRDLRAGLRAANRADRAALDSLDFALGGRLGTWLREAQGGLRPRRRWPPKMTVEQREAFERHVGAIRARGEAAECQMAALLTDEQRATLARIDSLEHRAPGERRRPVAAPGCTGAPPGSCVDPLPILGAPRLPAAPRM